MKPTVNFDSTLALSTPKTAIPQEVARQMRMASLTFAPYYNPAQSVSIDDARHRQSSYSDQSLTIRDLAEFLHLSLFETTRPETRPYPAAGGIYSVQLYLAALSVEGLNAGIHFVRWTDKTLEEIGTAAEAQALYDQLFQPGKMSMPLIALLVADLRQSSFKYRDAAYRMAYIEAGALLQTMYLAGAKLNLPICALGGISDRTALKVTKLEPSADIIFTCGATIGGR